MLVEGPVREVDSLQGFAGILGITQRTFVFVKSRSNVRMVSFPVTANALAKQPPRFSGYSIPAACTACGFYRNTIDWCDGISNRRRHLVQFT